MKTPFLVGEKVYLRPVEVEDAPRLQTWINDPRVTRTLLSARPWTLAAERDFVERASADKDQLLLGIALRTDDRLVGTVGLHPIDWRNRQAGFGIEIGEPEEWGKGYGRESTRLVVGHAFETLNLNRVWLHVYDFNARGLKAYEAVGFQREGVLREGTFREGRYADVIVMGLLRREWKPASAPQREQP